jgi:hypothetical protein
MRWNQASVTLVSAAVAAMALGGCSPQPAATVAAISDKVYSVLPDAVKVKAGIVSGELTEMKLVERIEEGTGRVASPARLTGKLVLRNVSADQSVRLIGGTITYLDAKGQAIKLEDNRLAPTLSLAPAYGTSDRLDPGQHMTHALEMEFPAEALKAKTLKDIRFALAYVPSAYKQEMLNFPVSIGGQ